MNSGMQREERSGFTLIETLVCVLVMAVLMSLALPALGKVRARALQAATLSNLRQSSQIITTYASDFRGSFPAFLDPRKSSWTLDVDGEKMSLEIERYFMSSMIWHVALADMYYGGRAGNESVYSAEQVSRDGPGGMPFMLSCTLFAKAEFWDPATRTGPRQYGATYHHDVQFPAAKAVLVCVDPMLGGDPEALLGPAVANIPVATADGGVRAVAQEGFDEGCETGEGVFEQSVHYFDVFVGLHTVGGVRGRDLR